jgi:hypothetical protein
MSSFRDFLREDNFWARVFTFAMIPFFWRISVAAGRRLGYEDHLVLIGSVGIWIGEKVSVNRQNDDLRMYF